MIAAPQTLALPLTRLELAGMKCRCGTANCGDELYFHGACHPQAQVEAAYNKRDGIVTITCGTCHKMITRLKVAAHHMEITEP